MDSLVNALFQARLAQGLSQADVGRRMGRTRVTVTQLEMRYYDPPIATLEAWAKALGYELIFGLKAPEAVGA